MFEGHSADTHAGKFLLASMGGRAEGLAFADPGARTPIGASGIFLKHIISQSFAIKEEEKKSVKEQNKLGLSCAKLRSSWG